MSMRDHHEAQKGPEHCQPHEGRFEHRPNGMSGHEFNHGFQEMIRAEQQMYKQMQHDMIQNGLLPPNPFMNGFNDDCGQQNQQKQKDDGGGILGGIKKVAGVVGTIAAFL